MLESFDGVRLNNVLSDLIEMKKQRGRRHQPKTSLFAAESEVAMKLRKKQEHSPRESINE
jgi:hypothetical protein